jgi:drug/metabolite transporter (DMT)-like permease
LAIALALGTSVAYGLANYLGPLFTRRWPLGAVLLVGQLAALCLAAIGVAATGDPAPPADAVAIAALAGLGNAVGLAAFLRATELGPVSIVAPIGSTGTVLPVIYDLAHGQTLSALELAGIVLAIGGAVLVARRPRGIGEDDHITRAGLVWAVVGALGFGLFLIALPEASDDGRWWALLDARIALVFVVACFLVVWRRPIRIPAAAIPRLSLPGVLLISGTVLYVLAAERGQLAVVSVLASLNTVVTVGLSVVLLSERLSRAQTLGFAATMAGVALLAA